MPEFERPDVIRPPSEWNAYYLPLTYGCSNHTCTFCNYYYNKKLRLRSLEEVKQEIDTLSLYKNRGLQVPGASPSIYYLAEQWDGKKVFLQDGDALVYPYPKLKEALEYLNSRFPGIERIGSYATPHDLLRRSGDELKELKKLKLDILYMGVESGDAEVLKKIYKGATPEEMVEAGRKAVEAGLILSVTVILGLGGVERSREHALNTAKVLSAIDPQYAGALTLTIVPPAPLFEELQKGNFHPITPLQSVEELKIMVENFKFTECFFSSMHASNYFTVRGYLPREKERMLAQLNAILKKKDPSLLRPEYLRGL